MAAVGFQEAGWGTAPQATISPTTTLTPEQQAALQQLIEQISGGPLSLTGNQLTAGATPLQQTSLTALEHAALQANAPGGAQATSTQALMDILGRTPADMESYLKASVYDPAMQQFTGSIMPEITRRFSGQAGFGSDRQAVEAKAAAETSGAVASQTAQALDRERQLRVAAAQALSGAGTANIQNLANIYGVGEAARQVEQAPLQAEQAARQAQINAILSALGIQGVENIATVTPGTAGGLQSFLGGFGSGLGQYLSDARLKTNIIRIGTHIRGFGVYLYQYIWSNEWFLGAMAQELQHTHPDAVITHPSGILLVDYKKLCM